MGTSRTETCAGNRGPCGQSLNRLLGAIVMMTALHAAADAAHARHDGHNDSLFLQGVVPPQANLNFSTQVAWFSSGSQDAAGRTLAATPYGSGSLLMVVSESSNLAGGYELVIESRNAQQYSLTEPRLIQSRTLIGGRGADGLAPAPEGALPYELYFGDDRVEFINGRAVLGHRRAVAGHHTQERENPLWIKTGQSMAEGSEQYSETLVITVRSP